MISLTEETFTKMFEEALLEVLGEIPDGVGFDSRFSDLKIDSLSRLEVMTILEGRLQTRVDDSMLQKIDSGRDMFLLLTGTPIKEDA
ncbi:hypothetical protein GCM10010172_39710 [Paractinoplanes ferrugineus]|uniref:Carrier domain-containing protein n=1 Tax=Paractinoplanes ferrugineus TaxID=113564 RepID=A0A919J4C9_9ACTN|nr:acyl carrier protein [Actinoplanes ferrugineus]GIE12748.1 hypothetical protein Afe05nite_45880 [Actinoplanes ferrugineus]